MKETYRAAKYIRTSCPDSEHDGRDSIVNQNRIIDSFLRTHPEIELVSEKIDDGYSGLFYDRPGFSELIAEIKSGKVDCLIIKDLTRLGRSYIEVGRYLQEFFPLYKVRFVAVDDQIDTLGLEGFDKILPLLKSIFSEQYCSDISRKTRSALAAKRENGEYVGAVPIYGYKCLEGNHRQLIPDLNTYKVVQSIFEMKLDGMSAAAIASYLNSQKVPSPLAYKRIKGIPHPTGGFADRKRVMWSVKTVLRILKDENYIGTLVQGRTRNLNYKSKIVQELDESKWIKVENAHLPLVSKADFIAVQRALLLDTRIPPGHNKTHLFSGLLICGCCGANMTRKTVKKNQWKAVYYYCPTGMRNGCATPRMIREEDLNRIVQEKLACTALTRKIILKSIQKICIRKGSIIIEP